MRSLNLSLSIPADEENEETWQTEQGGKSGHGGGADSVGCADERQCSHRDCTMLDCSAGCESCSDEPPLSPRTDRVVESLICGTVARCLTHLSPSALSASAWLTCEISCEPAHEFQHGEDCAPRSAGGLLSLECNQDAEVCGSGATQRGKKRKNAGSPEEEAADTSPTSVDWHDFEVSAESPSKRRQFDEPPSLLKVATSARAAAQEGEPGEFRRQASEMSMLSEEMAHLNQNRSVESSDASSQGSAGSPEDSPEEHSLGHSTHSPNSSTENCQWTALLSGDCSVDREPQAADPPTDLHVLACTA